MSDLFYEEELASHKALVKAQEQAMQTKRDELESEFRDWCADHGYGDSEPEGIADLIFDIGYAMMSTDDALTLGHMVLDKRWLRDFAQRWEEAQ